MSDALPMTECLCTVTEHGDYLYYRRVSEDVPYCIMCGVFERLPMRVSATSVDRLAPTELVAAYRVGGVRAVEAMIIANPKDYPAHVSRLTPKTRERYGI